MKRFKTAVLTPHNPKLCYTPRLRHPCQHSDGHQANCCPASADDDAMPSLIPRTKPVHASSRKAKSTQNPRKPRKGQHYQPTPTAFVSSNMSAMDAMTATNDKYQTFPIIWDTGASYTITPDKADFLNYSSTPSIKAMQGFGKDSKEKVQ